MMAEGKQRGRDYENHTMYQTRNMHVMLKRTERNKKMLVYIIYLSKTNTIISEKESKNILRQFTKASNDFPNTPQQDKNK